MPIPVMGYGNPEDWLIVTSNRLVPVYHVPQESYVLRGKSKGTEICLQIIPHQGSGGGRFTVA